MASESGSGSGHDLTPPNVGGVAESSLNASRTSKAAADKAAKDKAVLQRGRACLNCRKKKLKCDAIHPHCSPCLKSHKQHLATLKPGEPRPPFPECVWDDDKPDKASPGEKRRRTADGYKGKGGQLEAMESKIAELERQLRQVGSAPPDGQAVPQDPSSGLPPGPSFNLAQYPFTGPASQPFQQFHQPYAQQVQQQLHQQSSARTEPSFTVTNSRPISDYLPAFAFGSVAATPPSAQAMGVAQPLGPPPPPSVYNPHRHDSSSSADSYNQAYPQPPPFAQHESQSSSTGPSSVHSSTNVSSPRDSIPKAAVPANGSVNFDEPGAVPDSGSKGPLAPAGMDVNEAALEEELFFHALIYPSYPKNLPPPTLLHALVETFFTKVPTIHKSLHKAHFMTALQTYPPSHPLWPHPAVLHAICALASRHSGRADVASRQTPDWASAPYMSDTLDPDSFGARHADFAKQAMEDEFKKGERLFDALIACVILCAFDYQNARWVQVWLSSALCCRLAVPLGVNESAKGRNMIPGSKPSLLPRTDDEFEREQRRRVFWVGFMADRMSAASSGWAGSLDEGDIGAELPTKLVHFLRGTNIPENPQTLASPDLFTFHAPECTDSFVLHLKSLTLLSRVKQFNRRFLKPPDWPETRMADPRQTRAFQTVQEQVEKFRSSFPKEFKDPIRGADGDGGTGLDGDLLLAHLIPFVAMIVLHENHVDLMNKDDVSSRMMLSAARGMLSTIFLLLSTSYDLASLHPFSAFCFFAGGRALVRFYQAALFVGDQRAAKASKSEVEVFRTVLAKFGERIPLAHRQLQMLDMSLKDAGGFAIIPAATAAGECPVYVAERSADTAAFRAAASPSAAAATTAPDTSSFPSSQVLMETLNLFTTNSPVGGQNINTGSTGSSDSPVPFTPSAYFQPPPPPPQFPPSGLTPAGASPPMMSNPATAPGGKGTENQPGMPVLTNFEGASPNAIRKLFEEFETEEGGGFGGMWGSELDGGGGAMEWTV